MKKIILTYSTVFLLYSFIFLLSFHLPFDFQPVLFYKGIILLTVVTLLFLAIILIIKFKGRKNFNIESLIAATVLSFAIHLSTFVVFPVTFERSITMYLLNTLGEDSNQNCQGYTKDNLEKKLINEYILENKALDKRINEQTAIDFITTKEVCIELTPKAKRFISFSELVKKIYAITSSPP